METVCAAIDNVVAAPCRGIPRPSPRRWRPVTRALPRPRRRPPSSPAGHGRRRVGAPAAAAALIGCSAARLLRLVPVPVSFSIQRPTRAHRRNVPGPDGDENVSSRAANSPVPPTTASPHAVEDNDTVVARLPVPVRSVCASSSSSCALASSYTIPTVSADRSIPSLCPSPAHCRIIPSALRRLRHTCQQQQQQQPYLHIQILYEKKKAGNAV